jgi:hypothetical protein
MFERVMFLINPVDKPEVTPAAVWFQTVLAAGRLRGYRRREKARIALV